MGASLSPIANCTPTGTQPASGAGLPVKEAPHTLSSHDAFHDLLHHDAPSSSVPWALELFAGSARLSRHLGHHGFHPIAIDSYNQHQKYESSVTFACLADPAVQSYILQLLEDKKVFFVFISPPCDTANRGRKRPLPRSWVGDVPCPLRSSTFPDGLPSLTVRDHERVHHANCLYAFSASVFNSCRQNNVACILANPSSSLAWATSFWSSLVGLSIDFDLCMFGAPRPKRERWFSVGLDLKTFARNCDGTHVHAAFQPPGRASGRLLYPHRLCQELAYLLMDLARRSGLIMNMLVGDQVDHFTIPALDRQPRRHMAPLVSEYLHFDTCVVYHPVTVDSIIPWQAGRLARVMDCLPSGGGGAVQIRVGVLRSVDEFVECSLKVEHPFNSVDMAHPLTKEAIHKCVSLGADAVRSWRLSNLDHYTTLAKDLELEELSLKAIMDEDVRNIVNEKRITLMGRMLSDASSPDLGLVKDIANGMPFIGRLPNSGNFDPFPRIAELSVDDLEAMSPHIRQAVIDKTTPLSDRDLDKAVLEGTQDELRRGWLRGPFSVDELDVMFEKKWLCGRRFAIRQGADGDKVRLIDDFSISKVNAATCADEKIALQHVDALLAAARHWFRISETPLHLRGKCVDLESAYRQLAINPIHRRFAVISIWNHCTGGIQLYLINALPFGAVSSVYGFLRASSALQLILCRLFAVPMTIYFDDLTLLAIDEEADHVDHIVSSVLSLLGWKTSSNPKKQHPFEKVFHMLGVNVDLTSAPDGYIRVGNKPTRVEDVGHLIEAHLQKGTISGSEASSLRGKIAYMDAQHFARLGIPATRSLDRRSRSLMSPMPLSDELREALLWALFLLHRAPPRVVPLEVTRDQIVIFTDGAVEGSDHEVCSMGAVAFFPNKCPEYFSSVIPRGVVNTWKGELREHVIFQAEMLPIVVAMEMWQKELSECLSIFMIDNEAVRHSLISSHSRLDEGMKMIWHSLGLIARMAMRPWYARVPSACNIADAPSRGNTSELDEKWGARRVKLPDIDAWYDTLERPLG